MYSDIVTLLERRNLRPLNKDYTSETVESWPKMVHTRIEKLELIPDGSEAVIICADKNLLKVTGGSKPRLIAQYEDLCAYIIQSGYNYKITHIHTDIDEEEVHLPFYIYCFQ